MFLDYIFCVKEREIPFTRMIIIGRLIICLDTFKTPEYPTVNYTTTVIYTLRSILFDITFFISSFKKNNMWGLALATTMSVTHCDHDTVAFDHDTIIQHSETLHLPPLSSSMDSYRFFGDSFTSVSWYSVMS